MKLNTHSQVSINVSANIILKLPVDCKYYLYSVLSLAKFLDENSQNSQLISAILILYDSPLVHVVLRVIQPHPDLDGIALPDPVKNILHLDTGCVLSNPYNITITPSDV